MTGPSNRGHSMVPGIYGMFADRGRLDRHRRRGRAAPRPLLRDHRAAGPHRALQLGLLYFEDDKAALWPILDEVFATKTTAEWCDLLGAAGLRFAPVRDHAEVARRSRRAELNGYIEAVEDPEAPDSDVGRRADAGPLLRAASRPYRSDVPELGQHTEEVLLEAGYSWDDITSLSDGRRHLGAYERTRGSASSDRSFRWR